MLAWLQRLLGRGSTAEPTWLEAGELRRRLGRGEQSLIVDVRGPDEFDGPLGHIDGALNVPLAALPSHIQEIRRAGDPIVLVCLTDKRSAQAATQLAEAGVRGVSVLRGGMQAWRRE